MAKVTSKKIVRSAFALGIDELWESEAKAAGKKVAAFKAFAIMNLAARRAKTPINVFIDAFKAEHPAKVRGEYQTKLDEMNQAINDAAAIPSVQKVLVSNRDEFVKRHAAQQTNAKKAADAKKARKNSPVTTKLATSFDEFGMPIEVAA